MNKTIKMIIFMCLIILLSGCNNNSSNNTHYDFRYGIWGEDRSAIKERDPELDWLTGGESWEDDILMGDTTLHGYAAHFFYHFENNELKKGFYTIQPDFTDGSSYIDLYNEFVESLTKEYGVATMSEIRPFEEEIIVDSVSPSTALENGYVWYNAIFETETCDIHLSMYSISHEISMDILYTHTNYYDGKN